MPGPTAVKPRRPDRGSPAAWLGLLAPAALYLAAGALLRWAALWVLPAAGLGTVQRDAASSAIAVTLLSSAALYWDHRDKDEHGTVPESPAVWRTVVAAALGAASGLLLGALSLLAARAAGMASVPDAALAGPGWLRLLLLWTLCVAAPLGEEAVYRGLLFRRGEAMLGTRGAVLASALLFAAGHGLSPLLPIDLLAGLAFAGVLLWQRRRAPGAWALLAPALCHAAANLVAAVALQ